MARGRERRRRSPAVVVLAVVLVGTAAWAVLVSPAFAVRRIDVRGNDRLSVTEVEELAGVRRGENLVRLPLERVVGSLRRNPWVAEARARRSLPSTLVLEIEERRPVAWTRHPEGVSVLAVDGTVLVVRATTPRGLPSLGRTPEALAPGEVLPSAGDPLRVVGSMARTLRREMATARWRNGEVVLALRSGGRVLYGTATAMGRKNAALESLLRYSADRKIRVDYVDVRVPHSPALKPVGEEPALPGPPLIPSPTPSPSPAGG
jgi:cell division protein FtsQ